MRALQCVGIWLLCASCAGGGKRFAPHFANRGPFVRPTPLVESPNDEMFPSLDGGAQRLAYAAKVNGNLDIFIRHLSSTVTKRLTTHTAADRDPAFSPDGQFIAWSSQRRDVKGDIWLMKADGSNMRRLTGRKTSDRGPVWSPDGKSIYYTSRKRRLDLEQIDRVDVATGEITLGVKNGWDPALSPDGRIIFFASLDDQRRVHIFAQALETGKRVQVTFGEATDALPVVRSSEDGWQLFFARFADDSNGDQRVDGSDAPGLWRVNVTPEVLEGQKTMLPTPLTEGIQGEIFVSHASGWFAYTRGGDGDAEIYALPSTGRIAQGARPDEILAAVSTEEDRALRILGLRYVISNAQEPQAAMQARFQLSREFAASGRYADAIIEMRHLANNDEGELKRHAAIEEHRLTLIQRLGGRYLARQQKEREFARTKLNAAAEVAGAQPKDPSLRARMDFFEAEVQWILGRRDRASATFERLARQEKVPPELSAHSLAHLATIYHSVEQPHQVQRVCQTLFAGFPKERHALASAIKAWAESVVGGADVPLSAHAQLVQQTALFPRAQSVALAKLATRQEALGDWDAAQDTWAQLSDLADIPPAERADALLQWAQALQRAGDDENAVAALERVVSLVGAQPKQRRGARVNLIGVSLQQAREFEQEGELARARKSFRRAIDAQWETIAAHRGYIKLSSKLDLSDEAEDFYEGALAQRPRDVVARYAYGLALTYTTSPPFDDALESIEAALAVDPKLAEAHLSAGWIRMHADKIRAGENLLEYSIDTFKVAEKLALEQRKPQVAAAAVLNRGHAFFELGDFDGALAAYLQRELMGIAFVNPFAELIFRQNFARAAIAQGDFDLGLDAARLAYELSRSFDAPIRATTSAGLLAEAYWLIEAYEDALAWYQKAQEAAQQGDLENVVPLLRGQAMCLSRLGRDSEASQLWNKVIALLRDGVGARSEGGGLLVWTTEINETTKPKNVTRAPRGFSSEQELEIAAHALAAGRKKSGDLLGAAYYHRVAEPAIEEQKENATLGPRLMRELLHALHADALLAYERKDLLQAWGKWEQAVTTATKGEIFEDALGLIQTLAWLDVSGDDPLPETLRDGYRSLASLFVEHAAWNPKSPESAWREAARLLGLVYYYESLKPTPAKAASSVQDLLSVLDGNRRWWNLAGDYFYLAGQKLEFEPSTPTGDDLFRIGPQYQQALQAVLTRTIKNDVTGAWKLAEEFRLRRWQPKQDALGVRPLASAWRRLRTQRGQETYAELLNKARPTLQALEAHPVELKQLHDALGDASLLQRFVIGHETFWAWHHQGKIFMQQDKRDKIPKPACQALGDAPLVYLDLGEHSSDPSTDCLTGRTSEVLSATHLVSQLALRNLSFGSAVALADAVNNAPKQAPLMAHWSGQLAVAHQPFVPPAHLAFAPKHDKLAPWSSGELIKVSLRAHVMVASAPLDRLGRRHLSFGAWLSGTPTLLVLPPKVRVDDLAPYLMDKPFHQLHAQAIVVGFAGMDAAAWQSFALEKFDQWEKETKLAFAKALKSKDHDALLEAKALHKQYLGLIRFLSLPQINEKLLASKDAKVVKKAQRLEDYAALKKTALAQIHVVLGEHDAAFALQRQAAQAFEKKGIAKYAATLFELLGTNLGNAARPKESAAALAKCVELAKGSKLLANRASCRMKLGSQLRAVQDVDGAIKAYTQAIDEFMQLAPLKSLQARRYLGFIYENVTNDYDAAEKTYRKTIALAKEHKADPQTLLSLYLDIARIERSRGDYERALEQIQEALSLTSQASPKGEAEVRLEQAKVYWYRGNYRRAIAQQEAALELARKAESTFLEIQALSLAGLIARNQGELAKAARSIIDALRLARATGRRSEAAIQLNNLGTTLLFAGRLKEAKKRFESALRIDTELGSAEGRAFDQRNLGIAFMKLGDHERALTLLNAAEELSKKIGARFNLLETYFAKGQLFEKREEDLARKYYQFAVDLAAQLNVPETRWKSLAALGRIAMRDDDRNEARDYFGRALEIAERLGRAGAQSLNPEGRGELYADAIQAALADDDHAVAFNLLQRAKSRARLDIFSAQTLEIPDEAQGLVRKEMRARDALRRSVASGDEEAMARTRRDYDKALGQLRARFPSLARVFAMDVASLQALQKSLPKQTTYLDYFVSSKALIVLSIAREDFASQVVALDGQQLHHRVKKLRARMASFANVDDELRELSGFLVAPFVAGMQSKHLVISPHLFLHHVPFAALEFAAGNPLVAKFELSQSTTAGLLIDSLQSGPAGIGRTAAMETDLTFAQLESRAVASEFTQTPWTANTSSVLVAAHTDIDPQAPLNSAIKREQGEPLLLRQVMVSLQSPKTVALTGCDTAGASVAGGEWVGLADVFRAAGARTVVATLGRVSDLATAVLSKRFHRYARQLGKAQALQKAQLKVREYFSHPGYWANAVLVGDPR